MKNPVYFYKYFENQLHTETTLNIRYFSFTYSWTKDAQKKYTAAALFTKEKLDIIKCGSENQNIFAGKIVNPRRGLSASVLQMLGLQ